MMVDEKIIRHICNLAELKDSETVFEIGAGPGNLTSEIAKHCDKVIAIEIDKKFEEKLRSISKESGNIEIRMGNVLKSDIKADKVIGNLPYDALEPIFRKLMNSDFKLAVLTVSKSFANKLTAGSPLGVLCSYFFEIIKTEDIPRNSFKPEPGTDSAVIVIRKKERGIISEMLLQYDKKVKNALREAYMRIKKMTKREAKQKVRELKLGGLLSEQVSDLRPEEIDSIQKVV